MIDDYKFVMLDDHRIVVANLKNKIWRKVDHFREDNVPRLEDYRQTVAVCDNHLCHWLRWCRLQNKHRIICFDLCMENWTQDIPWPDYNDNSCDNSGTPRDKRTDDLTRLQFMNGFLSVLTQNNSGRKGYDLWVMKEYGIKESWVKLCGFSDPYCSPLAFDRGSHLKVLCRTLVRKKERVKWYDVREKQYKNAEIHDIHFVKRLHGVCVVNGSLVSIPGGKRILDSKDTTNDTQIASQAEKNTRICL
ncbi:uncharacterized protein LOC141608293 [Silene latifolia]|uniref:uncharacterized protein LOC141608293 n=1 Tax=Silene latifolia TaxID=37657 RepID=UPI003D76FBCE